MKTILNIILITITVSCYGQEKTPKTCLEEIAILRRFIIPPKGISKENLEFVFGDPNRKNEKKNSYTYELLSPDKRQEFRAFLYVTYQNGKVKKVGINHICVTKGRAIHMHGSPRWEKQQKEIEKENRRVLADLIEIKKKYESKLKNTLWNKTKSEQN